MPQYYLSNGESFWTEKELSPEELDAYLEELEADTSVPEITPEVTGNKVEVPVTGFNPAVSLGPTLGNIPEGAATPDPIFGSGGGDLARLITGEPKRNFWDYINTPLTQNAIPQEARELFEQEHPYLNFVGRVAEEQLTPLSMAATIATGGASTLARLGMVPKVAKGLHKTGQVLSGITAGEGLYQGIMADDPATRVGGGVQALLGALGTRAKLPQIGNLAADIPKGWDLKDMRGASMQGEAPPVVSTTAKEVNEILGTTKPLDVIDKPMDVTTETMSQIPKGKPRNLINEGTDIIDTDTGEVIDTTIQPKPVEPKIEAVKPTNPNNPSISIQTRKGKQTGRIILKNPSVETIQKLNQEGYVTTGRKNKDGNPIFRRAKVTVQEPESLPRQIYNLERGMMSIDAPFTTSAAFRQGLPWIGTRHWFNAYGKAVKAFGSEEIYGMVEDKIKTLPIFKPRGVSTKTPGKLLPSPAEEMGIRMVDASDVTRGEGRQLRINLAEKIPLYGRYVRASNRAYSTFLNDLRANAAQELWDNAIAQGLEPRTFSGQLGEFVNTSTGLGKLSFEIGTKNYNKTVNFEKNAQLLSDVFFSPRLMARNIRMLNPSTYAMAEPFVRKQYMYAMLRSMVAWGSMSSLAAMAGADVNMDPTNADFGKIKIGNTRLDPAGGLQQYLVLIARIQQQKTTSSVTGKTTEFGEGFKPPTTGSTLQDFGANKLHPVLKFAYDMAFAHPDRPMNMGDRLVQQVVPLYSQDIIEILNEHPELAPLIIAASSLGVGSQTYGEGKPEPAFIPEEYDLVLGGKRK